MSATSLPCDLLLDIFRRLGSTAVIRCAGVCRTWRRAIIDNARCLRPRPDRFLPDLLLAYLDYYCHLRQHTTLGRPEYVPSAENVIAMESVVDVGPYDRPLASRDGFVLLQVWDNTVGYSLCLCNILAGSCRFLSTVAMDLSLDHCSYVLVTAYDVDDSRLPDDAGGAGGSEVRILAVKGEGNLVTYQIFSTTSGAWGPVKRSMKLVEEDPAAKVCVLSQPGHAVVCGGSVVVYWLIYVMSLAVDEEGDDRTCLFAMDTCTERTWTTELPEEYMNTDISWEQLIVATAEDGRRLSLVASVRHQIEVWVLIDDGRWMLQRTMDLQIPLIPPYLPSREQIWLRCFCPRSGYLLLIAPGHSGLRQQLLVGVNGSASRLIGTVANFESWFVLPYEMDWSTYISKMKYF